MRRHYDFKNAVKNPYAGRLKDGYTIVIEHKDFNEVITVKKSKLPKNENGSITEVDSAVSAVNI